VSTIDFGRVEQNQQYHRYKFDHSHGTSRQGRKKGKSHRRIRELTQILRWIRESDLKILNN